MEIAPLFTTDDDSLVTTCMALLDRFGREDSAPFRAQQTQQVFQAKEQAELVESVQTMLEQVAQEIDRLTAERLVANNRQVPLLREADIPLIIRRLFAGEKMDDGLMGLMEMARPYVTMTIALNVCFLSAIDEDLYTAFWQFVSALFSAALEARTTPLQAVTSLDARNAVYRSCMTPASWQKMVKAKLAISAGFSPSKLLSGVTGMLDDATAAEMERSLENGDAEYAAGPGRAQQRLTKTFYTDRARQIWPTA